LPSRFLANPVCVLLTATTYIFLFQTLRQRAPGTTCAGAPVATLRERVIKPSVWITRSAGRIVLHLPQVSSWLGPWRQVGRRRPSRLTTAPRRPPGPRKWCHGSRLVAGDPRTRSAHRGRRNPTDLAAGGRPSRSPYTRSGRPQDRCDSCRACSRKKVRLSPSPYGKQRRTFSLDSHRGSGKLLR
jgi:hypothetical protein